MAQQKNLFTSVYNQKSSTQSRVVTGIASVIGNIDSVRDVVARGAFAQAVADFKAGRSRARFLWNHDSRQPPVAKILELREIGRNELPAAVLAKDPTAQGGLLVRRQYFTDEFSDRVYRGILDGVIDEMSFAYNVLKSSQGKGPDGEPVHMLEKLELLDLSDVNWGCNSATVAAGAKGLNKHRTFVKSGFVTYPGTKAGRRNSTADQKLVDLMHATSVRLGAKCGGDGAGVVDEEQKARINSLRLFALQEKAKGLDQRSSQRVQILGLQLTAARARAERFLR